MDNLKYMIRNKNKALFTFEEAIVYVKCIWNQLGRRYSKLLGDFDK